MEELLPQQQDDNNHPKKRKKEKGGQKELMVSRRFLIILAVVLTTMDVLLNLYPKYLEKSKKQNKETESLSNGLKKIVIQKINEFYQTKGCSYRTEKELNNAYYELIKTLREEIANQFPTTFGYANIDRIPLILRQQNYFFILKKQIFEKNTPFSDSQFILEAGLFPFKLPGTRIQSEEYFPQKIAPFQIIAGQVGNQSLNVSYVNTGKNLISHFEQNYQQQLGQKPSWESGSIIGTDEIIVLQKPTTPQTDKSSRETETDAIISQETARLILRQFFKNPPYTECYYDYIEPSNKYTLEEFEIAFSYIASLNKLAEHCSTEYFFNYTDLFLQKNTPRQYSLLKLMLRLALVTTNYRHQDNTNTSLTTNNKNKFLKNLNNNLQIKLLEVQNHLNQQRYIHTKS